MSIGGDKPVTVSLQTEVQGAHLKQQDNWPAAIASQRHRERTAEPVVTVCVCVCVFVCGGVASKTGLAFRGSKPLSSSSICDRASLIVFASKQDSLCFQSREEMDD